MSGEEQRLLAVSAIGFAIFLVLGVNVSNSFARRADLVAGRLRGGGVRAAALFTRSGRNAPLAFFSVLAVAAYAVLHLPLWIPATIVVSQVLSQGVVELCKRLFRRVRPDDWLLRHEHGFSYPSGHASTAVTFFGGWSIVVMHATMPDGVRWISITLLAIWMVGIAWSRLVLAAHYVTDVAGGLLFGVSWMSLVYAAVTYVRAHGILAGHGGF